MKYQNTLILTFFFGLAILIAMLIVVFVSNQTTTVTREAGIPNTVNESTDLNINNDEISIDTPAAINTIRSEGEFPPLEESEVAYIFGTVQSIDGNELTLDIFESENIVVRTTNETVILLDETESELSFSQISVGDSVSVTCESLTSIFCTATELLVSEQFDVSQFQD